ncbi:MAG: UDP-2,3-diacylglucosamine diphosphatase [Gammaproteobacteria bacterium]|nr:UDP-2,3-diacylglucosamine diphosphatase [Gammaproteobacteria bacterium]
MKRLLFIADLHLDAADPLTLTRFEQFCRQHGRAADALYILGDLFEAWAGDDADDAAATTAHKALSDLRGSGTAILFLHGNRDFLLGERFIARCGGKLLPDPSVIEWYGQRLVLCHGDSLCTADVDYQALRQRLRSPQQRAALLARPRSERETLARKAREASRRAGANKPRAIMDVTPLAVESLLLEHDADILIHGHTHRPADHRWIHAGRTRRRLVVGAWSEQAEYVVGESGALTLRPFP